MPPEKYLELLFKEIAQKHSYFPPRQLTSLYFGGGTPSLLPAESIVSIIRELANYQFSIGPETEVTIEINPYTVSEEKLNTYLRAGINRFSVGAQTFDDSLLKKVGREHDAKQTLQTLDLLRKYNLNFSFDILFALPGQSIAGLKRDLEIAMEQGAKHISPYCLTVPESHPLTAGRPIEGDQIEMFYLIDEVLTKFNFSRYEISNYSQVGYESRHNILYWTDQDFLGLGLSAHSYKSTPDWGVRFWNASSISDYSRQINEEPGVSFNSPRMHLPKTQFEVLEKHQALTDFCHTSLRLERGLDLNDLGRKFSAATALKVEGICHNLAERGWICLREGFWCLTPMGKLISNQVFSEFTFLSSDPI